MNDIRMIREYGPGAPVLSPAALAAARARLMAEATAAPRPRPALLVRAGDLTGRLRGRAGLLATAAAVTVVAGVVFAPSPQRSNQPSAGVSLVAFSTPVFPIALRSTPPGLSAPSFTGEAGTWTAVYRSTDQGNDVYLTVHPAPAESGIPCTATTIAGKPGDLCSWAPTSGGAFRDPELEARPRAVGRGHRQRPIRHREQHACPGRHHRRRTPAGAAATAPRPGRLDPGRVQDDSIITLRDPADPRLSLSVQAIPRMDPDVLHNTQGARHARTVQVNGQPGQLILTHALSAASVCTGSSASI